MFFFVGFFTKITQNLMINYISHVLVMAERKKWFDSVRNQVIKNVRVDRRKEPICRIFSFRHSIECLVPIKEDLSVLVSDTPPVVRTQRCDMAVGMDFTSSTTTSLVWAL